MKHGWLVCQGRGVFVALIGFSLAAIPAAADAQITGRKPAVATTTSIAPEGSGLASIRRGDLQKAAMVNTGYVPGTTLQDMDMRNPELWARAIIHSDGTYTETEKKNGAINQSMVQRTMSPNGVLLQERIIMADANGSPSEVLIKDATGQFKYRGVLLYDPNGRFAEEQLYDMNNQLLRRRIQDYGPKGEPKHRVVDYVENVPADLQLVVTEDTAAGSNTEQARRNYDRFVKEAREVPAAESGEKKQGILGRIFGRKKKD